MYATLNCVGCCVTVSYCVMIFHRIASVNLNIKWLYNSFQIPLQRRLLQWKSNEWNSLCIISYKQYLNSAIRPMLHSLVYLRYIRFMEYNLISVSVASCFFLSWFLSHFICKFSSLHFRIGLHVVICKVSTLWNE